MGPASLVGELYTGNSMTSNSSESAVCTYISYFSEVDRDGLGPTDSILCTYWSTLTI